MSKNGLHIFVFCFVLFCFFSFVVVTNVHLSIINSFYMYQIQFSPRVIFLSLIVLIVFNKNGPIRMQYLSVCGRELITIVTSRPSDLSVELKRLL